MAYVEHGSTFSDYWLSVKKFARGEVADLIRTAGGQAVFVPAELDGSQKASADLATAAMPALGGRIDILVNSAGIFPRTTTATTDEATFDQVYAVNVKPRTFSPGSSHQPWSPQVAVPS